MKKRIVSILCLFILLISCVGCQDSKKTVGESGKKTLRVATSGTYYPFAYKDGDEIKGFEADFLNEFAKRNNYEIKWVLTDFSGLFGLLESDKADVISAQLTPTAQRQEKYTFSEPLNYSGTSIVVRSDDNSIETLQNLVGKKVGIGVGAVANDLVKDKYPNGEIEIVNYSSGTLKGNYQDLVMGRLDAVIAQDVEALIAIKEENLDLKLISPPLQYGPCCFALQKNDAGSELKEKFDATIKEMREEGTLSEYSIKNLGGDLTKEPQ